MEKLELEVKDRTAKLQKLEDELRVREARREAELEIHEDKLAARLAQVEEREARLAQREADLAGYVERVPQQISAAQAGDRPRLHCWRRADVAELVDAHGSGPCARKGVEVQVLSSAYLAERVRPAERDPGGYPRNGRPSPVPRAGHKPLLPPG